jgi:hypothetical protein
MDKGGVRSTKKSTGSFGKLVRKNISLVRRFITFLIAFLLVLLVASLIPTETYTVEPSIRRTVVVIAGIVFAAAIRLVLSELVLSRLAKRFRSLNRSELGSQLLGPIDAGRLARQYLDAFFKSEYQDSLPTLVGALVKPSEYVSRFSQDVKLLEKNYDNTLTRLVGNARSTKVFPVLRAPKGTPLGNLKVFVDEKRARTLPFDLSKGLLLAAIVSTFIDAFGSDEEELLERCMSEAVARAADPDDKGVRKARLINDVELALTNSQSSAAAQQALRLIVLTAIYCDCVFVVGQDYFSDPRQVRLEYRSEFARSTRNWKTWWGSTFGLGHKEFFFDLPYVTESKSYHLDFVGPEGMYVAESNLSHVDPRTIVEHPLPEELRERDQILRISPLLGDNTSHLYLRDFDGRLSADAALNTYVAKGNRVPGYRLEFRETPPGMLGSVLAVSLWLAILTWLVGLFHNLIFPAQVDQELATHVEELVVNVFGPGYESGRLSNQITTLLSTFKSPNNQSWPAVILGFPAVITGWLLSKVTMSALRVVSFTTFMMLMWLALNSAAVVTLAALKASGVAAFELTLGSLHLEHTSWSLMMFSCALHAVLCLVMFFGRGIYYDYVSAGGASK